MLSTEGSLDLDRGASESIFSAGATSASSSSAGGPGTLAGKALVAAGEAALRGLEAVAIRRRLAAIENRIPLPADDVGAEAEQLFDDLCELSRDGLYDHQVRQRAISLIVKQIQNGHGLQAGLMCSLTKWPSIELDLFAESLLSSDYFTSIRKSLQSLLKHDWHSYCPDTLPPLTFICQLAQLNRTTFAALRDANLLDVLLYLSLAGQYLCGAHWDPAAVLGLCNAMLAAHPESEFLVHEHPLHDLWPSHRPLFARPPASIAVPNLDRAQAWRRIPAAPAARLRLSAIGWHTAGAAAPSRDELCDMYVDLQEFACGDAYPRHIQQWARALTNEFQTKPGAYQDVHNEYCRATMPNIWTQFFQSDIWRTREV